MEKSLKIITIALQTIFFFEFSLLPAHFAQADFHEQNPFLTYALYSHADTLDTNDYKRAFLIDQNSTMYLAETKNAPVNKSNLPIAKTKIQAAYYTTAREQWHTMTAYNSDPRQTDDTPCITANGFDVCAHGIEDTVAANFLPFNTKIKIPELFGDRVFVVRDRMNARFTNRVDVWMLDYNDARRFGVKYAKIEILATDLALK